MSKLYEALKNLENRNFSRIEEKSISNNKFFIENRQKYLVFLFLFLVVIVSGAGLIYLVEWHFNKEIAQSKIQLSSKDLVANKQTRSLNKRINSKKDTLSSCDSKNNSQKISSKVKTSKLLASKTKKDKNNLSSLTTVSKKKNLSNSKQKYPKKLPIYSKGNLSASKILKIKTKDNSESKNLNKEKRFSLQSIKRESKETLLVMAEEARQSGNYQEAIRYYRLYLRDRKDPQVLNNLGALFLLLRQNLEAIKVLEEAYQQKKDPEIAFNLALAYLNSGKTRKACQIMQETRREYSVLSYRWQALFESAPCNRHLPDSRPSRKE